MKILLIEDEKKLADAITAFLLKDGYIVETVYNFEQAIMKAGVNEYDCILIDIMLPDGSGLDLVRELKSARSDTGILIVSAKDSLDDKIAGLDLGADDYITKPFHLAELNARIKSVLRRKKFGGHDRLAFNELAIDTRSGEVRVHETVLELTKKEYELLLFFLSNQNRIVTKEAIAEHLWGDYIIDVDSFDFLYVHIKNLRKKIREAGGRDYIKTVYGLGYKFGDH
jgi:DNA-binding response OmpR family regulator